MTSYLRSTYQAQLPFQHLYTNSKQQILAKYWIESVIKQRLATNDLSCLKDGTILCKIVQTLVDNHYLPSKYLTNHDAQQPEKRIKLFLAAAKDFGLRSSELFTINDLIEGNMDAVASTILILAYLYSYKRCSNSTATANYFTYKNSKPHPRSNSIIDTLNLTIPNDKYTEVQKNPPNQSSIQFHTDTLANYNTLLITPNTKTMDTSLRTTNTNISIHNAANRENINQIQTKKQEHAGGETEDRSTGSSPERTYKQRVQYREGAAVVNSIGMSRATSSPVTMSTTYQDDDDDGDGSFMRRKTATLRRSSMSAIIQSDRIWGEAPCDIPRPKQLRSSCGLDKPFCRPHPPPFDFTNVNIKEVEQDFVSVEMLDGVSPSLLSSSCSIGSDLLLSDGEGVQEEEEEEEMYDTNMSHTPSSSGDSGYGTARKKSQVSPVKQKEQQQQQQQQQHNNNSSGSQLLNNDIESQQAKKGKAEDLFEAIFTPPVSLPSVDSSETIEQQQNTRASLTQYQERPRSSEHSVTRPDKNGSKSSTSNKSKSSTKKLSLLFSKSRSQQSSSSQQKKKEPHYVKFQSWSTGNNSNPTVLSSGNRASSTHSTTNSLASMDSVSSRIHEEAFLKLLQQSIEGLESNSAATNSLQDSIIYQEQLSTNVVQSQATSPTRDERRESILSPLNPKSIASSSTGAGLRARSTSLGTPSSSFEQHDYRSASSVSLHSTLSSTCSRTDDSKMIEQCDSDGRLIARYKLGNVIGKGHFGTVYRALDLISGKTVAIKQISLQKARTSDISDMMQEASLLSSLTHPNIVKYEGFIQTHQYLNIVLEYVENGSLLHSLKQYGHALPEHLVARYCSDILQGLAYLHEQDVVHCDVKAANILTTKSGDVKLSDFGVSLNLKLKKQEDNIVSGTPFWMAPEVIELKGASVKSDIWSLGCTLVELCAGKPPYADLLTMTAMFKIVEDDSPPVPGSLSAELRDFLHLCFKKNPSERPTASELLQHPWIKTNEKSSNSVLLRKASKESRLTVTSVATTLSSSPSRKDLNIGESTSLASTSSKTRKGSTLSTLLCSSPYSTSLTTNSDISLHQPKKTKSTATASAGHRFSILESKAHSPSRPRSESRTSKNRFDARKTMSVFESSFSYGKKAAVAKQNHTHSLIKISFPQGEGICTICQNKMYEALMCKDGCGFMGHPECTSTDTSSDLTTQQLMPPPLPSPVKPTSSVSSQLRQLFRSKPSKARSLHQNDLENIQEDGPALSHNNQAKFNSKYPNKIKVKKKAATDAAVSPASSGSNSRSSWWRKPLSSSSKGIR